MVLSILLNIILKAAKKNNNVVFNNQNKQEESNYPLYFLEIGNFLLMLGFILKVIHLYFYSKDGRGLFALDFISSMFKALSEATVLTILLVISWGWTINYYKCYYY